MAVRIIEIIGNEKIQNSELDELSRHAAINSVKWIDEITQSSGITSRDKMYDWLANKRGVAYVKEKDTQLPIPVFGRISQTGQYLIQAGKNGQWTNDLIDQLPSSVQPTAQSHSPAA